MSDPWWQIWRCLKRKPLNPDYKKTGQSWCTHRDDDPEGVVSEERGAEEQQQEAYCPVSELHGRVTWDQILEEVPTSARDKENLLQFFLSHAASDPISKLDWFIGDCERRGEREGSVSPNPNPNVFVSMCCLLSYENIEHACDSLGSLTYS